MSKTTIPKPKEGYDLDNIEKGNQWTGFEKKKFIQEESWHEIPKKEITKEMQRDLDILAARHTLSNKTHYKKNAGITSERFHVGTIVEGAQDFYSGRIAKKDRGKTLVDEIMKDQEFKKLAKKRMSEYNKKEIEKKKSKVFQKRRSKKNKK